MNTCIESLIGYRGDYSGFGINHEGQKFRGVISLKPVVGQKGILISFKATGDDGTLFHEESTLIAPNKDGNLSLWTLNNNFPTFYEHQLREVQGAGEADHTFTFFHNSPEDESSFREEIAIDLWANGDLSYGYSCGMPGGEYKERSGLRMSKKELK